ncbi:MAG: hypothetical protein Q7T54_03420 [Candidatus Levybacteria bacterium]|nr:hypothetical protein [Candidatus Levybacteria bacterium]
MEIINGALKKYINLSILEIFLFSISGTVFFYILKNLILPTVHLKVEMESFPVNLLFLLFWFLIFILGKRLFQGFYKFAASFIPYTFKSKDWSKQWDHQGNIRLWENEDNALYVTDSNSGCILKRHYWKNLEMSFLCKFPTGTDDQTVGIIFRAKSLSDYLMVQINDKGKMIVPHIRMEGNWETTRQPNYALNFEKDVYFDVILRVIDEKVELFINGNTMLKWTIPTNSDLTSADKNEKYEDTIVPAIDFRKGYGRIGFRAFQGENAVIKNLKVKRLPSIF